MKNYYSNKAKTTSATWRICLSVLLALILSVSAVDRAQAQCPTCNLTITANSSYTIPANQTYCLNRATYSSTITFGNNSTLCIYAGTTWSSATLTLSGSSGTINNYGTSSKSFTLPSGYTFNNYGTYSGTLTQSTGSTVYNYGVFSGTLTQNGGTFTNFVGGTVTGAATVKGTYINNDSISSLITISTNGSVTNNGYMTGLTISGTGADFYNYGLVKGAFIQSTGTATNYSGGVFSPSSTTLTAGSLTNNSGGTLTLGAITVKNGYTINNAGSMTAGNTTVNSGGIINFTGTQTITGTLTNNGTINLDGTLTATGAYSNSGGTIKAIGSGNTCNIFTAGSMSTLTAGTFNGNNVGLTTIPQSLLGTYSNGATGPVTAPTQQGTGLSASSTGLTISGSFTSPSLAVSKYIVLRYIGTSPASDIPSDNTAYAIGDAVGSSTVVALPTSTLLANSFTDNVPATSCGQTVYYRIFSFSGTMPCEVFDATSPLTGSVVMTVPSASITAGGPTTFCIGSSVSLTAAGGSSYVWSTGATTTSISANTNTTYIVTVTNTIGCSDTASAPITVNSAAPITPYINVNGTGWSGSSSASLCAGGSVEFGPQPTVGTWQYTGPSGFHSYQRDTLITNISTVQSGTYVATFTDPGNGCSVSQNYNVTVNAPPTPTVNSPTICQGSAATLTATGGVSYVWSTTATTASISVSPAGSTIYAVTATDVAGCTATSVGTVWVNPTPTASISASGATTFCAGGSVTLTASGSGTYLWSTGATTAAITVTPASTTSYTVTVTNGYSCTATASRVVTVNPKPVAASTNATSCAGAPATLTASGGSTYLWNTGATTASITPSPVPAADSTYTVTVTSAAGCSSTTTGKITVSNPTVTNPAVCQGATATATASGGGTYLWNTGATTASITSTTAGVYTVTVTNNALGCTTTLTSIITVNSVPTPTVNNPTMCTGQVATLTATGGVVYAWSTGATTASISTTTAGVYTVTATSMGSCTATASGTVTIAPNPAAAATSAAICSGSPAVLTASGGGTYVWSTGFTTQSISVTTAGTYNVTVTSAAGCSASAAATATTSTVPTAGVNSPSICPGGSATLTATGGATYAWSTGATTAGISVSPASTTSYTVTVSNAAGCTATAISTVTVNPLPTATASNGVICSGTAATLTASGGSTYHWSTGVNSATINPTTAGTYAVTVTSAAGCSATASATATTATKPTPTVNSPSVCNGTTVTLTATGGTSYLWSTTDATTSISVAPSTTTVYTVTATNASGCTASVNSTVTIYALPTVAPSSNSPILLAAPINLTANATGSSLTYSWSGPSSFTSATANPSVASAGPANGGIYYITVTDNHACTATANTTVILNYSAPGGLASNTALWLYAGTLAGSNGSNVTTWADQSQLNNNVTSSTGTSPTLVTNAVNSYNTVNFGGAGGLLGGFGTAITSTSVSAFVVTSASTSSGNPSGIFSIISPATSIDSSATNSAVLFNRSTNSLSSVRGSAIQGKYTNADAIGQYHMATSIFSTGGKDSFFVEGRAATTSTYAATAFNASRYTVGSRMANATANKFLNGQVAEVALFNRQVTNAERNQVESYLAIKYGFTLDQTTAQNYTASNGVVYWSASANGTYKNDIFGVGKDNVSALNQTQSVSINTNQLSITGATGLAAYSFLMVSDNNGSNTVTSATGLPNNINAKLGVTWRASQTGSRTSANYVFNNSTTNFGFYAAVASSMTPYMLIDSNADGVYETYVAATSVVGANSTFGANLKNGALFTFGFKASIDYGDGWGVPTTIANNGAGHIIVPGVYLGSLIDAEIDGQPSVNALGDDTIGLADEDGVQFNIGVPTTVNIVTMGTNTITVTASVAGYLNAWADLNQNNAFDGGSEYAIQNVHLNAGANTITFNVSDSVEYGPTTMRFRFATGASDVTSALGLAPNGEVEDYQIYVTAPLVGPCTNGFQNPGYEMGPAPGSYIITSETNLPYWRTTAADKQVEMWASNFNGVPAHGGSYFMELEANLYGALYQDVYTTPGTKLQWSFAHRGRDGADTAVLQIGSPTVLTTQATAIEGNTAWGVHNGFYVVPAGQYITRLQFLAIGSYGGNTSIGNFLDDVSVSSSFDYGDAPDSYKTTFASGGPYHSLGGNLYLGANVSCDADGTPNANANADTYDDGVTFPAPCANCNTYTVNISAYNNSGARATIAGWIDFNKNGVFDPSERKSITIPSSASTQAVTMTFTVNVFSAISATTFARFRIANDSTEILNPGGLATSGEVEDYKVTCIGMPTPVPTATPTPVCARGPMVLTSTGTAPFYTWKGPNGFAIDSQNYHIASVGAADSGYYRVYAVYANGCETDSAVKVAINNCFVNVSGNLLDDANGNGLKDGVELNTTNGQTLYAILSDNTNKVIAKIPAAADGSFSFLSVPAYTTGMTIVPSTVNPTVGITSPGPSWPTNWVGTKEQYGVNNLAGTGIYNTPNLVPVSVDIKDVSGVSLGYDRLPTSVPKNYTIGYPHTNAIKAITPANGLGMFSGSDPEDGPFSAGSTFTISSLTGLNGNTLYYDANGDGILQPYEQITGYTVITNVDPTKFIIKFTGHASTSLSFTYATTDAASKVDPAPATYTIHWAQGLPVKLVSFEGTKYNDVQTKLTWATAAEINNDHFEIERSADAVTFDKIGEVKGNGNSNTLIDYSMIDESPLTGANYYRLKQVDFDGKFEYSSIVEVDFGTLASHSTTTMNIYPNPLTAGKGLNIGLSGSDDNIKQIIITNQMGQTVYTSDVQDTQGYEIQGLDLPAGIYIVNTISQSDANFSAKIIVTK